MTGRALVLGGSGRLGQATIAELARRGRPVDAPARGAFDLPALDPSAVFYLAGFTDVAAAERPEHARAVARLNVETPAALAQSCARRGIPFAYVSTDYVFDGIKSTPYAEDDPVHPLQVYGASKLDGERAVFAADPRALAVRLSTLYGRSLHGRPAYVDAILAQARRLASDGGEPLEVVRHPVSSPTYAVDVAPALLDLIERGTSGIVHVVNDGAASRLELARATVELAGLADRVEVRTRPEPPGALARPAYSVLGTAKLEGLIGRRLPPWRDALARYIGEVES